MSKRATKVEAPPLFYIQNARSPVGNSALWWRVDGHGYTCNLFNAWQVTKEKAARICRDRPGEDFSWPIEEIDRIAELHVDVQTLGLLQSANAGKSQTNTTAEESANKKEN